MRFLLVIERSCVTQWRFLVRLNLQQGRDWGNYSAKHESVNVINSCKNCFLAKCLGWLENYLDRFYLYIYKHICRFPEIIHNWIVYYAWVCVTRMFVSEMEGKRFFESAGVTISVNNKDTCVVKHDPILLPFSHKQTQYLHILTIEIKAIERSCNVARKISYYWNFGCIVSCDEVHHTMVLYPIRVYN